MLKMSYIVLYSYVPNTVTSAEERGIFYYRCLNKTI